MTESVPFTSGDVVAIGLGDADDSLRVVDFEAAGTFFRGVGFISVSGFVALGLY